jgi:hypothetical protein
VYDLTIFKLHCGRLTLKIYTKGERVLRIEAMAHNTLALGGRRSLAVFPELLTELKAVLERFVDALSCVDRCFIGGETLDTLPLPSQVRQIQEYLGHANIEKTMTYTHVVKELRSPPRSPLDMLKSRGR